MMTVELIMQGWADIMLIMNVDPNKLTVGVMIIACGASMVRNFGSAFNATHVYLHTMGTHIAQQQGLNSATSVAHRRWLADTWWYRLDCLIQVCKGLRYLATHFSATAEPRPPHLKTDLLQGLGQVKLEVCASKWTS